ncbi:hypothetical protein, partial [Bradyrhizobium sp. 136]|uniref:hypothetical protein n=1 Tax=Bradyrhizobium sp. 136 TaxID=2782613 RepID=UPI001FF9C2F4
DHRKAARPLRRYLKARVRAALLYRATPPPGTRPARLPGAKPPPIPSNFTLEMPAQADKEGALFDQALRQFGHVLRKPKDCHVLNHPSLRERDLKKPCLDVDEDLGRRNAPRPTRGRERSPPAANEEPYDRSGDEVTLEDVV